MSDVIWTPPAELVQSSALAKFAAEQGFDVSDYDALHRWSVSDLDGFWQAFWEFSGTRGDSGPTAFLPDPQNWMTGARFFPEAQINLAENFLRMEGDTTAIIETDETGYKRKLSANELRTLVARCADGLRNAGVAKGDRVGVVLPNRIEALVSLLATSSLGAVWTSCSPDFGASAILDRIGQVRPKVLFAAAHVTYGGKTIDLSDRVTEVASKMDGLQHLVLVGPNSVAAPCSVSAFETFGDNAELTFTRVAFDDPVYVMYTSGTTGAPKAIVHKTGGVVMQQVKEHMLHADVREGDRVLWYTNTAWMMYHWLVAAQSCKATVVLYDGAPVLRAGDGLDGSPLWRLVEEEQLTHLGISPKYLATLADIGFVPKDEFDTSSLRWLLSSGSPMAPHQYDWMYSAIGTHMGFASISGGTDLMGCFLLGAPTQPVRRGALSVRGLGMAVNIFDDRGAPVIGRAGELVCTEPFPSMPLTFWGENGTERYHNAYFSERTEVWTHGDRATLNADGSAVIHGRSDFTLNPGGVRIGTADIYNICEQFDEIEDCIAFGRPISGDEEIILCLKMAGAHALTAELAKSVRTRLRQECSPRHVPAAIYPVNAIPYTLNNKRVEGAAKAMVTGGEVKNKASMANPECLDEYAALQEKSPF